MRRLILPSLALIAALIADFATDGAWRSASSLLGIERAIFAVVLVLAWRLQRGRVAWIATVLAATAELRAIGVAGSDLNTMLLGAGLWLCVDLAAAAVAREWWPISWPGALRLLVLGLQAGSVAWLLSPAGASSALALASFGATWPGAEHLARATSTPPLLALAWALALAVVGVAMARRKTPLEGGFFAVLAALAAAFLVPDGWRYYFAAAGLSLGLALIENAFALAFQDGLTGLPARRALEEQLPQLGRSYSLAMLDLDHFKKLNDRHGHEVGDQVLRLIASLLRKVTGGGQAFRYGGEEFTLVFAGRSAAEAAIHLDALRQQIASRTFTVRSPGRPTQKPASTLTPLPRTKTVEKQLKVTVSIGVAERGDQKSTPEAVLKAADKALYKSKKAGRNRVTVG